MINEAKGVTTIMIMRAMGVINHMDKMHRRLRRKKGGRMNTKEMKRKRRQRP